MSTRILVRRGLAYEWSTTNPVLSEGEIGFERDTKLVKIGDGITPWNDLPVALDTMFELAGSVAAQHAADIGTFLGKRAGLFGKGGLLPAPPVSARIAYHSSARADAGSSSRLKFSMTQEAANLQLVYANYFGSTNSVGEPGGPITVSASIEYPSGTYWPVHFTGENATRQVAIGPGAVVHSLPVGIDIPVGSLFYVNTTVVPAAAQSYPIGSALGVVASVGAGDKTVINSAVDYTLTPQVGSQAGDTYCFGPIAVCGIPKAGGVTGTPVVAVVGDSLAMGIGDSNSRFASGLDVGIVPRACIAAGNVGWLNFGVNGRQAVHMNQATIPLHPLEMASSLTDVVLLLGTNDLGPGGRSVAQLKADLTAVWTFYANRGVRVWQATLLPRTTSTDSWATTANQTAAYAAFGPEGGGGSSMTQINAWIKTLPAPLDGYIDLFTTAAVYLSAKDTWVWQPSWTGDGTHPNSTGTPALAAVVPVASFG